MTSAPVPMVSLSGRLVVVDRLRGLAVALMVLDHVLVQLDRDSILRVTVTRPALPLFMICAAIVWKPATWRRWTVLLALALVELVLFIPLGMGVPGIVAVFALVLVVIDAVGIDRFDRWSAVFLAAGILQALYLPVGWRGYEPGLVLAWFALGRLAAAPFLELGSRVPDGFASIGRRPLVWYVGHLVALVPVAVLGA